MAQELIGSALNLNGKRITEIVSSFSSPSATQLIDALAIYNYVQSIVLAGSNPGEVYNVRAYGAIPNAVVPASGNTVTGTDNKTAFDNCIAAAPTGAVVYIGAGNWLCSSLNAISTKKLLLVCDGVIYTNGQTWLTFSGPGGRDRHHQVIINGKVVGKVNYPGHTKTNYDNNTTGTTYWDTMTGSAILVNQNVNGMVAFINEPEGFKAGIEMVQGGGNGSQENTFAIIKHTHVRYPIYLRSTDGVSWCDKNVFIGPHDGTSRLSCEVPLKIDGYSGAAATNGETFNGAFRSNKFHFLVESATRVMEVNGDVTEPEFDITIEGGTNTGVFDPSNAIQCLSTGPNVVRGPRWCGRGVLATNWMTNGMGVNGTIEMQIWQGPGSTAYIGNKARIDGSANINIEVRSNLSKTVRDALTAQSAALRCVNEPVPKIFKNATSTYSNVTADAYATLRFNFTSSTFNAVNASTNVGVWIDLQNIHASGPVTITGVTGIASLAAGRTVRIESDGVSWRAIINP